MNFLIVTGMSGAGKTQAVNCLEDLGYYCVDNMPPTMIKDFIKLIINDQIHLEKVAFVADIRGGEFFDDITDSIKELNSGGANFRIIFLEASNDTLIKRYQETRRLPPLSQEGTIEDGIEKERKKLADVRMISDYIIDTTNMKSSDLSSILNRLLVEGEPKDKVSLTVMSFGYKNGIPLDVDYVFDVRFIPNPYYLASMKHLTGNSKKVNDYVMKFEESDRFLERIHSLLSSLIPYYARERKYNLTIAFGCTGGQHRSVVMANQLTSMFEREGRQVKKVHRDRAR